MSFMAVKVANLFQIPVHGYFHLHELDDEFTDKDAATILLSSNEPPEEDTDPRPVPARIEVRVDDVANAATIWFIPDPRLARNGRATEVAADAFGWYMVFHGTVLILGLTEAQVGHYIETLD